MLFFVVKNAISDGMISENAIFCCEKCDFGGRASDGLGSGMGPGWDQDGTDLDRFEVADLEWAGVRKP